MGSLARYWFYLLLWMGCGVATLAVAAPPPLQQFPSRLWQIDAPAGRTFLLGTMHVPDRAIVKLPRHIQRHVDAAAALVLEVRLTPSAQQQAADLTTLRGSQTLSDLLSGPEFSQLVDLFKPYGIRAGGLQRLKPWVAGLMLNSPPPSLEPVLDYALQFQFQQQGKPVYELESTQEQLQLFDSLSLPEQLSFLRSAMQQHPDFVAQLAQIKAIYQADDLTRLHQLASQQVAAIEDPALQRLMRRIIEDRNHAMVARMQPHLQAGNRLIAVGALHLTGPEGILNLLQQQGLRVQPVLAGEH